ncbi:cyclin-like protein [Thamnocephalis sphaerospora]|uniref:Cyclin-like protein n=1 Tax=Thamnocephalis sphaerospora TaxID=78915 RepID=A0A4P9XRM1_9FUNG|nr:cyclin-like protein [Thamnocephalis sphaerospora]|eukprot:RKP08747.1 cyclin-like protein [Thamnocephalis sphaerospora]
MNPTPTEPLVPPPPSVAVPAGSKPYPGALPPMDYLLLCGDLLDLPRITTAVAQIYMHRCNRHLAREAERHGTAGRSTTDLDVYLMTSACLHLACKSTETLRKVRDMVNVGNLVLHAKQPYLNLDDRYQRLRDSLVTAELMVLRILRFDVNAQPPHVWVARIIRRTLEPERYADIYDDDGDTLSDDGEEGAVRASDTRTDTNASVSHPMARTFAQLAWVHANDSMRSEKLALDYAPRVLALASVYMASHALDIPLPQPFETWCTLWGEPNAGQIKAAVLDLAAIY